MSEVFSSLTPTELLRLQSLVRRQHGVLSRADLLWLQAHAQADGAALLAQQLGLEADFSGFKALEVTDAVLEPLRDKPLRPTREKPFQPRLDRSRQDEQLDPPFWYVAQREWRAADEPDLPLAVESEWVQRPEHAAQHRPLLPPSALWRCLSAWLVRLENGRKTDVPKLVRAVSRAEHLSRLPRRTRRQAQPPLLIIDDRSHHLIPYWQDQHEVSATLAGQAYPALRFSVWVAGETAPRLVTADGLVEWDLPHGTTVLALSDLGALQNGGRSEAKWLALGHVLRRRNCRLLALLPCPANWVAPVLRGVFECVSWEGAGAYRGLGVADLAVGAECLLTALSPCIRIEPALLRDMRLNLANLGEDWQFPAAVEALCWQHAALSEPHSVAASWDSRARQDFLQVFDGWSEVAKTCVLETIRGWRATLSKNIWYEELLSLGAETQALECIRDEVVQAKNQLRFMASGIATQAITMSESLEAYYRRMGLRLPDARIAELADFQKMLPYLHRHDPAYDWKGINPQNLPPSDAVLQEAVLYQRGNTLRLLPHQPFNQPSDGGSPLALLKLRHKGVQVCDEAGRNEHLSLGGTGVVMTAGENRLRVHSDHESLSLQQGELPDAREMGRDGYGLYMDLELFGVVQRFRWIMPGRFEMGSPDDEAGRYDNEHLHTVTLTQGFWLADTTCTQALWEAVMGDKPSEFKGDSQRPVESVSWLGVQRFLKRLNEAMPLLMAGLPSEAQWEYACRAGTQSAFNFESELGLDKVNYSGIWDESGYADEALQKAQVVKHYEANEWGLYEMHGNVWEWCVDEWKGDLGKDAVSDPLTVSLKSGAKPERAATETVNRHPLPVAIGAELLDNAEADNVRRVLRGGSWRNSGRYCRSAFRSSYHADSRSRSIGFRFALGQALKTAEQQKQRRK